MSGDSLFYAFVLAASVALAALGWAAYIVCAIRMARMTDTSVGHAEADTGEAHRILPSAPENVYVAPPKEAVLYRPETEDSRPVLTVETDTGQLDTVPERPPTADAGSAAWIMDSVMDEHFEPASSASAEDVGQAWL